MNMKKKIVIAALIALPMYMYGQSVTSAYSISQQDLRGTARYMSMAGAFGALGGDLSAITQNPGGIGIYRSNEIGITFGLGVNNSKAESDGFAQNDQHTLFNVNNVGAVFSLKLYNNSVPNLNIGFVYNRNSSVNRRIRGTVPSLRNSLSNYIAGLSNAYGLNEADVSYGTNYDPYNPTGSRTVPWLAVMGYYGFLTTPEGNVDSPTWVGQFGQGTSGIADFEVNERGYVDNYNIILGGNIGNKVYLGVNFDITSLNYQVSSMWGETLRNAYVYDPNSEQMGRYDANWAIYDKYRLKGTGFKFNMGVIVKPIQELRLGFAFHTPTYYNLNETYSDSHIDFNYPFKTSYHSEWANEGYPVSNSVNFTSPWRIIASAAGVIANKLIVSADYEWAGYRGMKYSKADIYDYYDPWYDWDNPWNDWGWGGWYSNSKKGSPAKVNREYYQSPNDYANEVIRDVYKSSNTIRIGAEYRVLPQFSVRIGYSYTSSPVTSEAKNSSIQIPGTGVMSNYTLDDDINYVTCGIGYSNKGFYADLAYVFKTQKAEFFPYSPDPLYISTCPKSNITINNSNIALSLGYKF